LSFLALPVPERILLFLLKALDTISSFLQRIGSIPGLECSAASFRDWLIDRGLTTSSISRIFGTIRAVINLTIQEHGLDCRNAFANIYLLKKAEEKRKPIPKHQIIRIQKTCLELVDEKRLVIALISDTGMRLSEALGLAWNDVPLDHEYQHINLVEHAWRQLKTSNSK
jgi:integrase